MSNYRDFYLFTGPNGKYALKRLPVPPPGTTRRRRKQIRYYADLCEASDAKAKAPPQDPGFRVVYVIGPVSGHLKIGFTAIVDSRLAAIQTGSPVRLRVHYSVEVPTDRVREIERACHQALRTKRLSGEWFDVTVDEAIEAVRQQVRGHLGIHYAF